MTHFFCTYFDWNYRQKGLALRESLERHCSNYHLWILALDKATNDLLVRLALPRVTPIAMGSFEDRRLLAVKKDRSTQEYYWTCTPGWILFVLNRAPVDHVNYIDADCCFFSSPEPVFQEIGRASLAVTPHDFPQKLRGFLSNGIYNVGMVHAKKNKAGLDCVEEWEKLCLNWCYLRHDPRYPDWFCDQKYWDKLVPKYNVHVIQHNGANRAPWNMEKHVYSMKDGSVYVGDRKLIWWHYHRYISEHDLYPETYTANELQLDHVYRPYTEALRRADARIK